MDTPMDDEDAKFLGHFSKQLVGTGQCVSVISG
jgi:hypothetical protein